MQSCKSAISDDIQRQVNGYSLIVTPNLATIYRFKMDHFQTHRVKNCKWSYPHCRLHISHLQTLIFGSDLLLNNTLINCGRFQGQIKCAAPLVRHACEAWWVSAVTWQFIKQSTWYLNFWVLQSKLRKLDESITRNRVNIRKGCPIYHIMKYNTVLQCLMQNINQSLYSQRTPHISPSQASYGVSIVRILRKFTAL